MKSLMILLCLACASCASNVAPKTNVTYVHTSNTCHSDWDCDSDREYCGFKEMNQPPVCRPKSW